MNVTSQNSGLNFEHRAGFSAFFSPLFPFPPVFPFFEGLLPYSLPRRDFLIKRKWESSRDGNPFPPGQPFLFFLFLFVFTSSVGSGPTRVAPGKTCFKPCHGHALIFFPCDWCLPFFSLFLPLFSSFFFSSFPPPLSFPGDELTQKLGTSQSPFFPLPPALRFPCLEEASRSGELRIFVLGSFRPFPPFFFPSLPNISRTRVKGAQAKQPASPFSFFFFVPFFVPYKKTDGNLSLFFPSSLSRAAARNLVEKNPFFSLFFFFPFSLSFRLPFSSDCGGNSHFLFFPPFGLGAGVIHKKLAGSRLPFFPLSLASFFLFGA